MYGYLFIGIFQVCLSKETPLSHLFYESNCSINRLITISGHFFRDVKIDGIPFPVRQIMDQSKIIRSLFRNQAQGRDLEIREGWVQKRARDSFGFIFFINFVLQYFFLAYKRIQVNRQPKSAFTSLRDFKTLRKTFYSKGRSILVIFR